jgi:hypothetical protein
MSCFRTAVFAILIFGSMLTTRAGASYVYDIQNYPGLQNGWSLSGHIVTDINSGSLASSDILSWNWTATNGNQTWTVTSTSPDATIQLAGTVVVTPTQIEIPVSTDPYPGNLFALAQVVSSVGRRLSRVCGLVGSIAAQ